MSLSYEERKKTILERLAREERLPVPVLAEALNVSSETIRRDLERLEKEGKLKKVYGGAVLARSDSWEPPFDKKTMINIKEKRAIGKLAASLVEDGDVIMLGNGTTPLELIRYLDGKKNVTLITHSAPAMLLAIEVFKGRIIFIGGEVDVSQKSTHGPLSELTLRHLKADKAFISAGGVSIIDGITDYDLNEAYMSHMLMERAEQLIVLADHTKFGKTTLAHICSLKNVSTLISDTYCPEEWKQTLAGQEIELLLADKETV
ncbi:DeoR/GlpR family DNA-binding transcription regulator [Aneurinibacillus terranovensis]|uniref:DeoR/GlpR family DNA-binding transcription regulator n=1 Tax=Aneurinibacillus terranovensis TaxID=278991 RepID=UPI0003F75653|nr:DeoR/GlpR family DNA-binding transcription regulator [Aneurinibacillus terranovensis]